MKKLIGFCLLFGLSATAVAGGSAFTQAGLNGQPVIKSCYRDPCSVARVMDYQVLQNNASNRLLKLKVAGGSQYWDSNKINWNNNFHNVYIRCSRTTPKVQIGTEKTLIPLNPKVGVPGVLVSDTELYLKACHNFDGRDTDAARKFGYNIVDW